MMGWGGEGMLANSMWAHCHLLLMLTSINRKTGMFFSLKGDLFYLETPTAVFQSAPTGHTVLKADWPSGP